jgi:hypothetical protein
MGAAVQLPHQRDNLFQDTLNYLVISQKSDISFMVNGAQCDCHRPAIVSFLGLPAYVQAKKIFR